MSSRSLWPACEVRDGVRGGGDPASRVVASVVKVGEGLEWVTAEPVEREPAQGVKDPDLTEAEGPGKVASGRAEPDWTSQGPPTSPSLSFSGSSLPRVARVR